MVRFGMIVEFYVIDYIGWEKKLVIYNYKNSL